MSHIFRALAARLARLERTATPPREGYLQVFRHRDEMAAAALARCGIDPSAWPQVRIRPWVGRGEPPAPGWISTVWTPRDPADIEQRTRQANERILRRRREKTVG